MKIIRNLIVSLVILVAIEYLILSVIDKSDRATLFFTHLFLLAYLFFSPMVNRRKADLDDIWSWDPYVFSDDYNQQLLFVDLFFRPGKFISYSFIRFYRLLRSKF